MVMTDQDLDGSHIKGLCINLFHSEWASLVQLNGFISFMNTPILRAKKGNQTKLFYNEGEYAQWKEEPGGNSNGWTIKYFKGLGTSTSTEFKEYFANRKIVDFVHTGRDSDDIIDKVFNKKRTEDRKTWLENYDKTAYLDTHCSRVNYEQFIDNELIHFSTYDCARSIPNMVDGLKISLRKILFSAFKRRLTSEIKVAQFSGYVSEHSAYHHGEASLNGAIVNMAQNYVGSNNINLLEPNGQFGTRLHGGDDSASERYIFTLLNPITRYIFPEVDDAVLTYINDDGTMVEPEYYVPIIPFALINGISGIGTGFSCNIPAFSPTQIIEYLQNKLRGETNINEFVPYYEGFKGTVAKMPNISHKYIVKGCYERVNDDKIRITELPVGLWTMQYIGFLEGLMDGAVDKKGKRVPPSIRDFTSISTEVMVDITVTFTKGKLGELLSQIDAATGINGVEKLLKLSTTISTTNMHMFNSERKLHKYASVEEVIDEFYDVRISMYRTRKEHMIAELQKKLVRLSNRARYITETLDGTIDLRRKTAVIVTELLTGKKYDMIDGDYKYLIKMPMDSVTQENVEQILKACEDAKKELEILQGTTLETMWLHELDKLQTEYIAYQRTRAAIQTGEKKVVKKKIVRKK